jgi:hypothetical protein
LSPFKRCELNELMLNDGVTRSTAASRMGELGEPFTMFAPDTCERTNQFESMPISAPTPG